MSGNKRKQPVAFTEPPEPPFLRRMKEQLGYKEGPNIDTKREDLEKATLEDEADRDDEKPTVVVIREGDLTEDEAKRINADVLEEPGDGKITFKKPTKRQADDAADDSKKEIIKSKLEKKESHMAQVKNKSLLSFDDEEDDDN